MSYSKRAQGLEGWETDVTLTLYLHEALTIISLLREAHSDDDDMLALADKLEQQIEGTKIEGANI